MLLYTLLVVSSAITTAVHGQSLNNYQSEVTAINESRKLSVKEKSDAINKIYEENIPAIQGDLTGLSGEELHELFSITNIAFFYSQFANVERKNSYIRDLRNDYLELMKRGVATNDEVATAYRRLISARAFGDAEKLLRQSGALGLASTPVISTSPTFDAAMPAVYSLAKDGSSLNLHNVSTRQHHLIVVVAQCHFARDAALMIASDSTLSNGFKKSSVIWVENASEPLDVSDLKAWNEQFPEHPLSIVYDNATWPYIDFSISPTFFFFEDGRLVSKRTGWSQKTSRADLVESLKLLGVLD
ncbi:hypothetical protein SAMN05216570_2030 [Dyella sp. OK004]|uniref:hypothetical protein n=1 Tax=Dyella sp. OK004 TaxID=1855292 RepID=UPI0008F2C28A|nr:hypothetical protein [Dyella sp. OK004]SFS05538.1 hypothetical protein SAMN05216570_2030 [Dyella sp. OK004]